MVMKVGLYIFRRRRRSLPLTILFPVTAARTRLFSSQSWLSDRGNPLINWPSPPPSSTSPSPRRFTPRVSTFSPPMAITESQDSVFNQADFATIYTLLRNPDVQPGPPLEYALNGTGVVPDQSLLQEIFKHFDSSPKPLFTLFLWAVKQPGYQFSVTLFNSMVNLLGKARDFDSAWSLIHQRLNSQEGPNVDTFTILIRRYARAGMPFPAIRTFEFASGLESIGPPSTMLVFFEILLDSLCKEGHVKVASEYFERKKVLDSSWSPSIRAYNILLNGWFRSRKLKHAERLWLKMKRENVKPSVVTYGTLVEGYCRMCRVEMAMELVYDMKQKGIEPNAIVYNPIIDALGEARRFKEALGILEKFSVLESGPTLSSYNSLVKGYCKAKDLEGASKILKTMISKGFLPTPTTYNYFFKYFAKFGKIEEGLNLYSKIIESGYVPDKLTYHLLVKMLCEQERLDLAMQIVKEMRARGYDMDLASSTMLIHLLCKMHRFDEALIEFEDMIRRGIVPQYLTYQKLSEELRKQRRDKIAQRVDMLMASVPHSRKLPNTYRIDGDESRRRRTSIIKKAKEISDVLKMRKDRKDIARHSNRQEKLHLV